MFQTVRHGLLLSINRMSRLCFNVFLRQFFLKFHVHTPGYGVFYMMYNSVFFTREVIKAAMTVTDIRVKGHVEDESPGSHNL